MNNKLQFQFQISKTANLFHFISNLTNWHFSCRPRYKKYWIEKTGSLSKEESELLEESIKIFTKYGLGKDKFYWGKIFFQNDDSKIWSEVKKIFSTKEYPTFKKLEKVFLPRFEKLWKKDKDLLEKWASRLTNTEDKGNPPELVNDLDNFFDVKKRPKKVTVFLLMNSPSKSSGGGANIGSKALTLECSQTPLEYIRPVWLIIWHELVHAIWQKGKFNTILERYFSKLNKDRVKISIEGRSLRNLTKEAIVESIFPRGYLAQKHLKFPVDEYYKRVLADKYLKEDLMRYWREYSANKLRFIAEEYISESRTIDSNFFDKVIELAKEFSSQIQ